MTNPDTKALREALAKATLKNNWWIDGASDGIVDLVELVVNAIPALLDRSDELERVKVELTDARQIIRNALELGQKLDQTEAELDRVKSERNVAQALLEAHDDACSAARERAEAAESALAIALRERDEAREALKPFAAECDRRAYMAPGPDIDHWNIGGNALTFGDLRRARAALSPKEPT